MPGPSEQEVPIGEEGLPRPGIGGAPGGSSWLGVPAPGSPTGGCILPAVTPRSKNFWKLVVVS